MAILDFQRQNLELEIVWEDEHMIELELRASDGFFSVQTRAYSTNAAIVEFADAIATFPRTSKDTLVLAAGEPNGEFFNLQFYCIDGVGHTAIRITVADYAMDGYGRTDLDRATFRVVTSPESLRQFSIHLKKMVKNRDFVAAL